IYNENINAGYIALNTSFGKSWKIETGIRVENTNIKGELAGNTLRADSSFTNHYTHIFPFLQMQYQWKDRHQLSFLSSKRIVQKGELVHILPLVLHLQKGEDMG